MQFFLLPLVLVQSLVSGQLSQESQETVVEKKEARAAGENFKVEEIPDHQNKILPAAGSAAAGIGTTLKVNLTPGFRNGGDIITQETNNLTICKLLT